MKAFFTKLGTFFQLLDSDGNLSITNIGLIALLLKVLVHPQIDWASVTTLVLAFANYAHKRQNLQIISGRHESIQMAQIKEQYEAAVLAQATAVKTIADGLAEVRNLVKITDLTKLIKR